MFLRFLLCYKCKANHLEPVLGCKYFFRKIYSFIIDYLCLPSYAPTIWKQPPPNWLIPVSFSCAAVCSYVRGHGHRWLCGDCEHWHFFGCDWDDEKEIFQHSAAAMYPWLFYHFRCCLKMLSTFDWYPYDLQTCAWMSEIWVCFLMNRLIVQSIKVCILLWYYISGNCRHSIAVSLA